METSDHLLYCYNKGCGQRFDPDANFPDSCVHHPGVPVFHDAYKGWSCCQKKTTDFTEFLSITGCTIGSHNSQKPHVEKTEKDIVSEVELKKANKAVQQKVKVLTIQERPDKNSRRVDLHFSVTQSLKMQLENLETTICQEERQTERDPIVVAIGTFCKNGGCRKTFSCEADNRDECHHHPGQPIFHEGLKFWSCCVRRTSDFSSFLEQVGCATGSHRWFKPQNSEQEKVSCRYDWYQTGSHVYISLYAKTPMPSLSRVTANAVFLSIQLVFGQEKSVIKMDMDLFGIVHAQDSHVTYSPNKVEIKLKKGEPATWPKLILPPCSSS